MATDPRIPIMPGRSTSGSHRQGRHCLHQAQRGEGGTQGFNSSHLEDSNESVEAVYVKRIDLMKVGDEKVEQASPPCHISVLLGERVNFLRRQLLKGTFTLQHFFCVQYLGRCTF